MDLFWSYLWLYSKSRKFETEARTLFWRTPRTANKTALSLVRRYGLFQVQSFAGAQLYCWVLPGWLDLINLMSMSWASLDSSWYVAFRKYPESPLGTTPLHHSGMQSTHKTFGYTEMEQSLYLEKTKWNSFSIWLEFLYGSSMHILYGRQRDDWGVMLF